MSSNPVPVPLIPASDLRHRLRTPLNHIIGYSEMLLEDNPPEAAATRLSGMIGEAKSMLETIQRRLGSEQGIVSPVEAFELRSELTGRIEKVRRLVRELRSLLSGDANADLARIDAAASELAQVSPLHPPSPAGTASVRWRDTSSAVETAPGRILVVDDNEANRDMLRRQLEKQQHEVSTAADGFDALAQMRESRFDIVLLDLMMPGMDGFEVLQKVKRDPAMSRTAVILVSALDEMDAVAHSIEAGAEDYLFKPVNPTLLRARIQSTLEKQRTEEAISRQQRFESIGMLAAGIAHDFNNLLTGIIGHAQLLQSVLRDPEDREMADSILQAGERAAELTRQLLAYSGKGMFQMQDLDVSSLVRDTEALMRAGLPSKVLLETRLGSVAAVSGDANQIRQALLNLTMNAGEACGEKGGTVVVATGVERIESGAGFQVAPDEVEPGDYAWIEVRDTGCGMEAQTIGKIFEPFFSTKFLGRGLGLAAVAGIVRSHGGLLRVESVPEAGSCFRMYLPLVRQPAPAQHESPAETVLVADDEPIVRQIVKVALERAGYKVIVAESGEAAIEAFASERGRVSLVLLDWKMPGMDGTEALRVLRKAAPNLKVIISSGLPQTDAEYHFKGMPVSGYLQKPYRMSELTTLVNAILNA
jgi:DNA-binding response OmpR family regulator